MKTKRGSPYNYDEREFKSNSDYDTTWLVHGFGGLVGEYETYEAACAAYREAKKNGMAKMSRKEVKRSVETEVLPRWYYNW